MSLYLSAAQKAKELINQLDTLLTQQAWQMRQEPEKFRIDALYEIPLRNSPNVPKDSPILVGLPDQGTAIELAVEVLSSIWLRSAQSPKETLRAPGAIALPADWIEQINTTNKIRLALFETIKPLTQPERIDIWRAHPGICSLQALRLTPILSAPFSLRFYWDTGASIERKQVKELIESYDATLHKKYKFRPTLQSLPLDASERKLVYALECLEKLPPDEHVAIYRPVTPHIRARVRDDSHKGYICSAPVPFVYSDECITPKIKALQNYEPSPKKNKRSIRAQLMKEPFVEAMNIYRYMENHRTFGPVASVDRTRNKLKKII